MRSSHSLDRLDTAFDDDRLVADAGLLLPATLAHHLGLKGLVESHLDLGAAVGAANAGDKFLTLVMCRCYCILLHSSLRVAHVGLRVAGGLGRKDRCNSTVEGRV